MPLDVRAPTAPNQISPSQAATIAKLVIYAEDCYHNDPNTQFPKLDHRIAADGWTVLGNLIASDFIVVHDQISQKKKIQLKDSPPVFYGILAKNAAGNFTVAIRGTQGIEEWWDDAHFAKITPNSPLQGQVEEGFYDIFKTLQFVTDSSGTPVPAGKAVASLVGNSPLTITGHSLGSAIATYFTAALTAYLSPRQLLGVYFATPKPGDQNFANYFDHLIPNYQAYALEGDIVPDFPPDWWGYSLLPRTNEMVCPANLKINCNGSKISCYLCHHHLLTYVAVLDYGQFQSILAPANHPDPYDVSLALCVSPVNIFYRLWQPILRMFTRPKKRG